jgi:hypothetical protein
MAGVVEKVCVPKWALEYILRHGNFWDRGPSDVGWSIVEMEEAIGAIEVCLSNDEKK